jgi:hypothetical protein
VAAQPGLVAELYDYSNIGVDPLKTLVQELGLKAIPMHGHAVVLGDEILRSEHEFRRCFGLPAFRALNEFHKTCAALYSSSDYYEGHVAVDRHHPWAHREPLRRTKGRGPGTLCRVFSYFLV